jgi:hypothetical protein
VNKTKHECIWNVARTQGNRIRYQSCCGKMNKWRQMTKMERVVYRSVPRMAQMLRANTSIVRGIGSVLEDFKMPMFAMEASLTAMEEMPEEMFEIEPPKPVVPKPDIRGLLARTQQDASAAATDDAQRIAEQAGVTVGTGDYPFNPETAEDWSEGPDDGKPKPLAMVAEELDDLAPPIPADPNVFVFRFFSREHNKMTEYRLVFASLLQLRARLAAQPKANLTSALYNANRAAGFLTNKTTRWQMAEQLTRHLEPPKEPKPAPRLRDDYGDDIVWASFDGGPVEPIARKEVADRINNSKTHIVADDPKEIFYELNIRNHKRAVLLLVDVWQRRPEHREKIETAVLRQNAFHRDVLVEAVKGEKPEAHLTTKTTKARLFEILTGR